MIIGAGFKPVFVIMAGKIGDRLKTCLYKAILLASSS
jgi:hypothetical protein